MICPCSKDDSVKWKGWNNRVALLKEFLPFKVQHLFSDSRANVKALKKMNRSTIKAAQFSQCQSQLLNH